MEISETVEMGAEYRDLVSGFKGVATSEHRYLNGCKQIGLTGKSKENKKAEAMSFDIEQIERVGDGALKKLGLKKEPGRAAPRRSRKGGPAQRAPEPQR